MILVWIAVFFVVTSALLWLLLFAQARERLAVLLQRAWRYLRQHVWGSLVGRFSDVGTQVAARAQDSGSALQRSGTGLLAVLKRHRLVLIASLLMLTVPPALILLLRYNVVLEGYSDEDQTPANPLIGELLRGERLIPPQPLPPEVFATAEVMRIKPEIVKADRRWPQLDADLQQRVLAVYRVMREQYGYEMVLTEGYRSPERQASLPASVTRAGPWQSCHQYGLAVDSAVFSQGKLQWDLEDDWVRRGYQLYGQLSRQAGLTWGGDWRSIRDYPHIEKAASCNAAKKAKRQSLKNLTGTVMVARPQVSG